MAGQRKASLFQLPATDPNFTGRSIEITKIEAILTSENPTVLISAVSGMGGVGKSTLAKAIGNRLKTQYPDGQLYVDLRGQSESPREPIAVLSEFLIDGFGDDPQNLPIELDRLQNLFYDRLTGRKILVVLDNAADAAQVEPLLPRVNGCGALVTSREKLVGLSGIGRDSFVPLDVMTTGEAIALLDRLCGEKTQGRELTAELVRLCGSLPLALTIVGRLLFGKASLTLVKLIAELGEERSRLRSLKYRNNKDEIDPKLDVEASFNLSYRQLLPEQQRVFESVAVLRGVDFGVELAAVLGEMEETQVQQRLDQLVALALVEMPKDTVGRYRFHDLMREFGREKLEPEREEELTGQALEWYDDNANTFDNYLKPKHRRPIAEGLVSEWEQPLETIEFALDVRAVEWFLVEHSNLLEAVNWSQDLGEHGIAVQLAENLVAFFQRRSLWSDWVTSHLVALKSARAIGDQQGIAQTIGNLGIVYRDQGKWDDAIDCCQQSLEILRTIGDQQGIARTIANLGAVYQLQGRWDDAIDCCQQDLNISRAIGDQYGIAQTIGNLGAVYQLQGKWDKAIDCYQQSLEVKRTIGDHQGIAQTSGNLGGVYQLQGRWDKAIDCYQQSLGIKRAIGDQHGIAQTVMGLGSVYQLQGKWDEAIDCYQQSLEIKRAIGDQQGIATTINNLGSVYSAQKKWDEAIDCYQQSLEIKRRIGDQHGISQTIGNLGFVYSSQKKWDEAIDCCKQSLEIKRAIGDQSGISTTMMNLGTVYKLQGKWEKAIDCYQQSLEIKRAIGDQHGIAQTIGNLGNIYKAQGKWEEAIDCYQQSIQASHQIGDPQTEANGWYNLGSTQVKLGNPAARTSYQNAKALYEQLKFTNDVQDCDNAIATIDNPPKKRSFPLWQRAIVLLVLGIGWMAIKPQVPAPQNGEVRIQK